jgi:ABC-type nitrate/sulfonate/bicarbonate transport system substrate-binding protein
MVHFGIGRTASDGSRQAPVGSRQALGSATASQETSIRALRGHGTSVAAGVQTMGGVSPRSFNFKTLRRQATFAVAAFLGIGLAACGGAAAPASSLAPSSAAPASAAAAKPVASAPASAKPAASAAASAKPAASAGASGKPAASGATAPTGKPERDKITLTYGTASGEDTFAHLAAEKGFFQKYGVTVDVQFAQSTASLATLTSGQAQLNLSDGVLAAQAVAVKTPVKVLAYFDKISPYAIVSQGDIKQPADLKGKIVAVSKLGDTSDVSLHIGMKPYNINPTTDMQVLQIGNSPARWAALTSKQVQGAIIDEAAYADQAKAAGMNVLVSLKGQKLPYVASALMGTDDFIKNNPNTVEAVLRGLIDGTKYQADEANKADVMADMARELKLSPGDAQLQAAYDAYHARSAGDPFPDKNGIDTILGALKDIDPKQFGSITADDIIDASFMTKIRGS